MKNKWMVVGLLLVGLTIYGSADKGSYSLGFDIGDFVVYAAIAIGVGALIAAIIAASAQGSSGGGSLFG